MKSPAMAKAMNPLRRLEIRAQKANETEVKAHKTAAKLYKIRADAAEKKNKAALVKDLDATLTPFTDEPPDEPRARRYIVDDASYEKLGDIMANNPKGVLAFRDELVSLLRTLDREEYAAARGFYLAAWGGKDGYTFDRIVRGTQHIEAACLSLLGGTQPSRLAEFVRRSIDGGIGDDGMIQRFSLAVWPDGGGWREVTGFGNTAAKQAAFEVFERLDGFEPEDVGAVGDAFDAIPYLTFDNAAQEIFSDWHHHLEVNVLRGSELSPSLMGHFSKYRKLVPALALINRLAEGGYGDVGENAIVKAIAFSRYLETHARRIYAAGLQNETNAAKAILDRVSRGYLKDGFTARDVYQNDWANLSNPEQVKTGLGMLVELGWLADKKVQHFEGGRPTVRYFINPLCKKGA